MVHHLPKEIQRARIINSLCIVFALFSSVICPLSLYSKHVGDLNNVNLFNFGLSFGSIVQEAESSTVISFSLSTTNRLSYLDSIWYHQFNSRLSIQVQVIDRSADGLSAVQPIENLFFNELVLSRRVEFALDPFVSCSYQTPVVKRISLVTDRLEEDLIDPGTFVCSAGLAHQFLTPSRSLSMRLGMSYNVIRADSTTRMTDNPKTELKERRLSFASADFVLDYQETLDSLVKIGSRIDLKYGTKYEPFVALQCDLESRINFSAVFGFIVRVRATYDERLSKRVLSTSSLQFGIVLSN